MLCGRKCEYFSTFLRIVCWFGDKKMSCWRLSRAFCLSKYCPLLYPLFLNSGNTRWFKYDRDKLWFVYTQIVPVIFEPPCIYNYKTIISPVDLNWSDRILCSLLSVDTRTGCEVDQSPPYNGEVKNRWSCTSTPLYAICVFGDKFPFFVTS
jgi:hypothetical protein